MSRVGQRRSHNGPYFCSRQIAHRREALPQPDPDPGPSSGPPGPDGRLTPQPRPRMGTR